MSAISTADHPMARAIMSFARVTPSIFGSPERFLALALAEGGSAWFDHRPAAGQNITLEWASRERDIAVGDRGGVLARPTSPFSTRRALQ